MISPFFTKPARKKIAIGYGLLQHYELVSLIEHLQTPQPRFSIMCSVVTW